MLIDKIKEIVKGGFQVGDYSGPDTFKLKEDNPDAKLKEILVEVNNGRHLLLKFDKDNKKNGNKLSTSFYNTITDVYSINDYICFSEMNGKYYTFILNLKSEERGNNIDQIFAGEILAKYIISTANRLLPVSNIIPFSEIHFSYILFSYGKESGKVELFGDERIRYLSKNGTTKTNYKIEQLMYVLFNWNKSQIKGKI